jgi:chromate transporter
VNQAGGPQKAPASCTALFLAFQHMALQGFGGVLPVAQRVLVEQRHWLTKAEFLALLSVSQVLPGPNVVNLALIFGDKHFGWRGAVAALAGILLAPLVIVLLLAAAVQHAGHGSWVQDALRGMGVVAAGLVLSTAFKLSGALRQNRMGLSVCAALAGLTVLFVGFLRWPLVWVLLGLAVPACVWAWRRLAPSADGA